MYPSKPLDACSFGIYERVRAVRTFPFIAIPWLSAFLLWLLRKVAYRRVVNGSSMVTLVARRQQKNGYVQA